MGAIFEGIGVSSGSFIAGYLFESVGGSQTFRIFGFFALVFCAIHVVVQKLMEKYSNASGKNNDVNNSIEEIDESDNITTVNNINTFDNSLVSGKNDNRK